MKDPKAFIDEARRFATTLEDILRVLAREFSESSNLEEALRMSRDILVNLNGAEKDIAKEHFVHPAKCPCDSCVAARSDEHHDRKVDGGIMM